MGEAPHKTALLLIYQPLCQPVRCRNHRSQWGTGMIKVKCSWNNDQEIEVGWFIIMQKERSPLQWFCHLLYVIYLNNSFNFIIWWPFMEQQILSGAMSSKILKAHVQWKIRYWITVSWDSWCWLSNTMIKQNITNQMKTRSQKSLKMINFKISAYKETVWLQQFNVCECRKFILLSFYRHDFHYIKLHFSLWRSSPIRCLEMSESWKDFERHFVNQLKSGFKIFCRQFL